MSYFLLQEHPEADKAGILENVRIEYSLVGENVHLVIRRDVQGIKVRGRLLYPEPGLMSDSKRWGRLSSRETRMRRWTLLNGPTCQHRLTMRRLASSMS